MRSGLSPFLMSLLLSKMRISALLRCSRRAAARSVRGIVSAGSAHVPSRVLGCAERNRWGTSGVRSGTLNLVRNPPGWLHHAQQRSFSGVKKGASPGGIVEVPLAQTGEGIADCELLKWLVTEGEDVEEFQPLCQVQSDKASVDISSRYKGRVTRICFMPGDVVKVGETLLEISLDGGHGAASVQERHDKEPASASNSSSSSDEEDGDGAAEEEKQAGGNALCTPAVRRLAREYGINLSEVAGSGEGGRVLRNDVINAAGAKELLEEDVHAVSSNASPSASVEPRQAGESESVPQLAEPTPHGKDFVIPVRGFRRAMAKTMAATTSVPHFYYVEEIEMDCLVELRRSLLNSSLESGVKLTYLPFMIKALSVALHKFPIMNSSVSSDLSEITCRASHNIGVAIATESGLVVPNIKNVQQLSVLEIAAEMSRLASLARTNSLSAHDVSAGTISLSNIGAIGGKNGYPLLNLPEVAIVALGRIQKLPQLAEDGSVTATSMMTVTWGADHRVVDGATVARFCNEWKTLLEEPGHLILNLR